MQDFPRNRLLLEIGPPGILPQLLRETEIELGIEPGKRIKVIKTMESKRRIEENGEEPPQLLKAIAQLWQVINTFFI